MSIFLADIDATCAALGYDDGIKYQADPDAIQGLKVILVLVSFFIKDKRTKEEND